VSTPLVAHFILSSDLCPESNDEIEYISRVLYSSAIGYHMYAIVCSHSDLSQALSIVSRFMANPGKELFSGFSYIYEVRLMPICNLEKLEIDLLIMLILIMLVI